MLAGWSSGAEPACGEVSGLPCMSLRMKPPVAIDSGDIIVIARPIRPDMPCCMYLLPMCWAISWWVFCPWAAGDANRQPAWYFAAPLRDCHAGGCGSGAVDGGRACGGCAAHVDGTWLERARLPAGERRGSEVKCRAIGNQGAVAGLAGRSGSFTGLPTSPVAG